MKETGSVRKPKWFRTNGGGEQRASGSFLGIIRLLYVSFCVFFTGFVVFTVPGFGLTICCSARISQTIVVVRLKFFHGISCGVGGFFFWGGSGLERRSLSARP